MVLCKSSDLRQLVPVVCFSGLVQPHGRNLLTQLPSAADKRLPELRSSSLWVAPADCFCHAAATPARALSRFSRSSTVELGSPLWPTCARLLVAAKEEQARTLGTLSGNTLSPHLRESLVNEVG